MADTLRLHVARVEDADTLMVEGKDGREVPVRLWGIDAPEGRQPYGQAATEAAEEITSGETVEVDVAGRDRYGRIVGRVRVGDTDLGERSSPTAMPGTTTSRRLELTRFVSWRRPPGRKSVACGRRTILRLPGPTDAAYRGPPSSTP